MKKQLVLSLLAAASSFALTNANANVCPFTDHFFIKANAPLSVLNSTVEGNLKIEIADKMYFKLSCNSVTDISNGTATVVIGMNDDMKCSLKIVDGPFVSNPYVTEAYCSGTNGILNFIGMDHTKIGSKDYILKFKV